MFQPRSFVAALTALAAVALVETASPLAAYASEARPAYQLSLDLDVPMLLLGGSLSVSYLLMSETDAPGCAPRCNRANVNPFDRPFAGYYSARWQTAGDLTTAAVLVLVPAALIFEEGARSAWTDVLVVGESVLMTVAVQAPVSYAVGRPRPRLYGDSAPLSEREGANAGRSFFSGHVANCVAASIATTRALRRLGRSGLARTTLAVGLAGSALVGLARVEAGSHFPSDVLVGAAVGTSFGLAVPALHTLDLQAMPLAGPQTSGLAVTGAF
ncbi:MAG TPA: phosphatase PAP2 family protein [Polyangia bacterium]